MDLSMVRSENSHVCTCVCLEVDIFMYVDVYMFNVQCSHVCMYVCIPVNVQRW